MLIEQEALFDATFASMTDRELRDQYWRYRNRLETAHAIGARYADGPNGREASKIATKYRGLLTAVEREIRSRS